MTPTLDTEKAACAPTNALLQGRKMSAAYLQDLDFAFDLALAHGLETLDYDLLLARHPPPFKDLAVFPPTHLPDDFVIFAVVPLDRHILIVCIRQQCLRASATSTRGLWLRRR